MDGSQNKNMEIFNAVTQIVLSSDFNQDSKAFIENNYAVFDEEDENKHEYKQIYEDYVNIMDRIIT